MPSIEISAIDGKIGKIFHFFKKNLKIFFYLSFLIFQIFVEK